MLCADRRSSTFDAPLALVDLGDTLCDCSGALHEGLARLRGPGERAEDEHRHPLAPHLEARRELVMAAPGFWACLPPLPLGMELLQLLRDEGFVVHVVTKGPRQSCAAWADKVAWCRQHLPGVSVVVTDDKALVHGDVLVDDWLPYVERWQRRNGGGLAIVPAHPWNTNAVAWPRCVRYDGRNRPELRAALRACREGLARDTAKATHKPDITESDRS